MGDNRRNLSNVTMRLRLLSPGATRPYALSDIDANFREAASVAANDFAEVFDYAQAGAYTSPHFSPTRAVSDTNYTLLNTP